MITITRNLQYLLGLALLTLGFFACDPDFSSSFSCDDCLDYVPSEGKTIIKFTINEENPQVPYYIYNGKNAGEDTLKIDTATTESESIFLATEQDFSAEAIYKSGNKTIHVFDGGEVKVSEEECDETVCYRVKVLNLDLTLDN